mmetsp:Transcript_27390/g.46284  ORF Transcript_27390/g.46284 Transcript_27390/m.46284 type:complete len:452 (-) Transcript_27390:201-1556(-)
MSHLVCYDCTSIDHPEERAQTATQLFHPDEEVLAYDDVVHFSQFLFDITLCNYDLSKVSEEPRKELSRSVQSHHLDRLAGMQIFEHHCMTSTVTALSMLSMNCPFGFASGLSSPDGVGTDDQGFVRMVFEVKHNVSTPAVALRQAISEGTNVAWAQLRGGVKWSDIYVPLVGGNGYLMQFAVLVCLNPGFPISFMMSKVLDLTDSRDRLVAAGHLWKIKSFISSPLELSTKERELSDEYFAETKAGYNPNLYHLKSKEAFFASKGNYDDSLLHLLSVMNALFVDESIRGNILFPLCIRQDNFHFDLVFRKLIDYSIGVPKDPDLRGIYIERVEQVLHNIHRCGVAHLDFYPSNIMWKQTDANANEIHVMIIDWDSGHFIHENLSSCVNDRLSRNRKRLMSEYATAAGRDSSLFDYDLSLFKLLKENINDASLQSSQKMELDAAFLLLQNPP